jgi:two-component system response regulator MtrA
MLEVLVVDDDHTTADLLVKILRHEGFHTAAVTDPHTALATMLLCPPKVVLLDWLMPGVGGNDILRLMRGHPKLEAIRALVYSAADPSTRNAAMQAGADAFLQKAKLDVPDLLRIVRTHVEAARAEEQPFAFIPESDRYPMP